MQYYNLNYIISTFFGLGFVSKKFPGTIGSLAGIPVCYAMFMSSYRISQIFSFDEIHTVFLPIIFITALLWFIGAYAAHNYSITTNKPDPKEVVIDEVLGQALVLSFTVPITTLLIKEISKFREVEFFFDPIIMCVILSFILFRIFDILKPWPIKWVDKKIKNGFGIMLDDFLAAIFSIIVYSALLLIIVR